MTRLPNAHRQPFASVFHQAPDNPPLGALPGDVLLTFTQFDREEFHAFGVLPPLADDAAEHDATMDQLVRRHLDASGQVPGDQADIGGDPL